MRKIRVVFLVAVVLLGLIYMNGNIQVTADTSLGSDGFGQFAASYPDNSTFPSPTRLWLEGRGTVFNEWLPSLHSPKRLAVFLWSAYESRMVDRFPDTKQDQGSKNGWPTRLIEIITDNTPLAIELAQEFQFGWRWGGNRSYAKCYCDFWVPNQVASIIVESAWRSATQPELYRYIREELGFDEAFTVNALNTAHEKAGLYYSSVKQGIVDASIYGEWPFIMRVQEPSFVLWRDKDGRSHITGAVGGGVPETFLREQKLDVGQLRGYRKFYLIVPQAVAADFKNCDLVPPQGSRPQGPQANDWYKGTCELRFVEAFYTCLTLPVCIDFPDSEPTFTEQQWGDMWTRFFDVYGRLTRRLSEFAAQLDMPTIAEFTPIPASRFAVEKNIHVDHFPGPFDVVDRLLRDGQKPNEVSGADKAGIYAEMLTGFLAKYERGVKLGEWTKSKLRSWLSSFLSSEQLDALFVTGTFSQSLNLGMNRNPSLGPNLAPMNPNYVVRIQAVTTVTDVEQLNMTSAITVTSTAVADLEPEQQDWVSSQAGREIDAFNFWNHPLLPLGVSFLFGIAGGIALQQRPIQYIIYRPDKPVPVAVTHIPRPPPAPIAAKPRKKHKTTRKRVKSPRFQQEPSLSKNPILSPAQPHTEEYLTVKENA